MQMMINAPIVNVANNKYIVLSQRICTIQDNNYNYNKVRLKNESI